MEKQSPSSIFHAIYVDENQCIGCTRCMKICSTAAIRICNGTAMISNSRCIDCGECIKACNFNAIHISQGDLQSIFKYKYRVALIPAVLFGQFKLDVTHDDLHRALLSIGFTSVYEEELSAEFQIDAIRRFQQESDIKPVISSFCPAIVRLIQVRFPTLTENLVLVKSLIDITGLTILKEAADKGIDPSDVGIFYITPCAAKICAVVSPVGDEKSPITGFLNMDMMFDRLSIELQKIKGTVDPSFKRKTSLTRTEVKWSLTGGEIKHAFGRKLSIDGIANVIEFLNKVDDEAIDDIDFLELRACDQGCAGGILTQGNRFLTVEKLMMRANKKAVNKRHGPYYSDITYDEIKVPTVNPRPIEGLDKDISVAIKKMEQKQEIYKMLPQLDCGCCGCPTCEAFSEDVVKSLKPLSSCMFIQVAFNSKNDRGKEIIRKIWGDSKIVEELKNKLENDN
jgi:iron only hydrogenase large subunit-like protein